MTKLPAPVERLWNDLEKMRAEVLREADGLSQRQVDWKPAENEWSVGELIDHLTLAEIATGKVTTKLTREAESAGALAPFPSDLTAFVALPLRPGGAAVQAPQVVWPQHGKAIGDLIATMKATRERSRQSIETLSRIDPRPLRFKHPLLGDLDLAQWWMLQAAHDGIHLAQMKAVKASPGFPK
jgi:DinB family protein